jgi:hypothetical protein
MTVVAYEKRLKQDTYWALEEGSMHFENASSVHKTMKKVAHRLEELGIPYAVAGAMAMFLHGYERFTVDVDILVTREGLKKLHEELEGRGFLPPFEGSKNLRDTDSGVKIDFMVAGDYPGDGKPKPVAFPDPNMASTVKDGIRLLTLPRLVELKLASGMTNPGRVKDLGDAQELMRALALPEDFAEDLNPFVRDKYRELWAALHNAPPGPVE